MVCLRISEITEFNGFHTVSPRTPQDSVEHLEGAVELMLRQTCRWLYFRALPPSIVPFLISFLNWGIGFYCLETTNCTVPSMQVEKLRAGENRVTE